MDDLVIDENGFRRLTIPSFGRFSGSPRLEAQKFREAKSIRRLRRGLRAPYRKENDKRHRKNRDRNSVMYTA